jgi:alanine racemase
MSLTLTVDGDRWRGHLRAVAAAEPGLVPVAKGNGYGFTLGRLARKAQWLGADTLAVGTYEELREVQDRHHGSLLVLTPWRPFGAAADLDPVLARRVIHTISRPGDLTGLLSRQAFIARAQSLLSVETARDSAGLLLFRTDPMKRIARATN